MDFQSMACYSTQLSYPDMSGEGFEPSTHKVGKQHRAKQHVILNFSTTLWRHTETLIRSYTFCFFHALSRHSHGERSLTPIHRSNIYQRTIVVLSGFEPKFPLGQQGCKCASLLYFYRAVFRCNCKLYPLLRVAVTE